MEQVELICRRLINQHLIERTAVQQVVKDLCGIQAQIPAYSAHALTIRSDGTSGDVVVSLLKSWTLRGTMHIFHEDDLPLMLHEGRTRKLRPCDTMDSDECLTADRKRYFSELMLECVKSGINERDALKSACLSAGMTNDEEQSAFNPWGGLIRAMCEDGRLVHQANLRNTYQICPAFVPMKKEEAEVELLRRYFAHYGPADIKDAAYFFGTTQALIKRRMCELPLYEAQYENRTLFWIEENGTRAMDLSDCVFLAGFDPMLLGYEKSLNPILPQQHRRGIFTLSGIVMPSVLVHGHIVGKWKREKSRILVTLFEPVDKADRSLIEEQAARLWTERSKICYIQ